MGNGASEQLGRLLTDEGFKHVVLLTDSGIEKSGIAEKIASAIRACDIEITVIGNLSREPSVIDFERVQQQVRRDEPDCVIAVGGGSVLDVGKLCAVLGKSDLKIQDLLGGSPMPQHMLFTVLVPTTAGTGSEATKNAIFAILEQKTKEAIVHEKLLPDLVMLDPTLTLSLPASITATTGMDALCHAMECYLSKKANPLSDLLALAAMRQIARSIRKVYNDGSDIDARSDMLLASYYGGMCITLSGTNAVHALSYPLGATFHIPHGQANAMLLPAVMKRNLAAIPQKTKEIALCFGYDQTHYQEDPIAYMNRELNMLLVDLQIARSLKIFGVRESDLPFLVESAYNNRRLMDNNPCSWTKEQVKNVYVEVLNNE